MLRRCGSIGSINRATFRSNAIAYDYSLCKNFILIENANCERVIKLNNGLDIYVNIDEIDFRVAIIRSSRKCF